MSFKKLSLIAVLACSFNAVESKTFVYCSEGSPSSFNPQLVTDGPSINASAETIYSRLVDFVPGTTKIRPLLAEKYDISKNQLVYTFTLKKNVEFHTTKNFAPTRPLNADDVVFSIMRQWDKTHPYNKIGGGNYEYFDGMGMRDLIKSVKALAPDKVEITLSKPNAPFLANMAMGFMSILSKEYADKLLKENKAEMLDKDPVGTGPFVFNSYQKDNSIRYSAHPKYFGKKGNIEKLIFAITADPSVRAQKLKVGECHLISEPTPNDLVELKKNNKISVLEAEGMNTGYLAFNTSKKPFDQLKVRKAIYHALAKKSYIENVYLGQAVNAKSPFPQTVWSYNKTIKDYEYDVTLAKKLMTEANLANGFDTEIWYLPVTRPYMPNGKKLAELMQADLAKINIRAKITTFDWPTYLKKSKEGAHQMIQFGWSGDNGDPDNFLNMLLSCQAKKEGSNFAQFCHKEFDDLINKAAATSDLKTRTKLYEAAQVVFHREIPWVPIAHGTSKRAMLNKVKNYTLDPLGRDSFTEVNID